MIVPHPESDLGLNVMVLGAEIIKILNTSKNKDRHILVENVLGEFLKPDERRTPDLFIYSLLFLYSVGLVERKGYKVKLTPRNDIQTKLFE